MAYRLKEGDAWVILSYLALRRHFSAHKVAALLKRVCERVELAGCTAGVVFPVLEPGLRVFVQEGLFLHRD